jgi:hypothetical protein
MSEAITITADPATPTRFRFTGHGGRSARLMSVTFVDAARGEPIWAVFPFSSRSVVLPFTADVDDEEVQAVLEDASRDPIEDLPPTHPEHQRALEALMTAEEALLVPLSEITYGVVPEGFRQMYPMDGPPPALVSGTSYTLHVCGPRMAVSTFTFEFRALA